MRRLIAAILAVGSLAAGCGTLPGETFAPNGVVAGPWRPDPVSVDPATIAAGEQACRVAESNRAGRGPLLAGRPVAVDARGGGRLTLLFVAPGDAFLQCQLRMEAQGPKWAGETSSDGAGGAGQLVGANDVVIFGRGVESTMGQASSSVLGRMGSEVTAVRVVPSGETALQASVGGGWFIAWWPAGEGDFVVEGFDAAGRKVGEAKP